MSLFITAGTNYGSIGNNARIIHTDASTPSVMVKGDDGVMYYTDTDGKYIAQTIWDKTRTHIALDENTKEIDRYGIYLNNNVKSIQVPAYVNSVRYDSIYKCFSLESIVVDSANQTYDSRNNCNAIIQKSNNRLILGSLNTTVPSTVISIGANAFEYFSTLTSIKFENNSQLTTIGDSAFIHCAKLVSIDIPDSVTSIGDNLFYFCTNLANVKMSSRITSIPKGTFQSCEKLINITIPKSVTSIGSYAFSSCRSLTNITIPDSVTSLGSSAFSSCSGLTSVTISEGLISLGSSAFYYCSKLTSITIPKCVTTIESQAFYNCSGLTSITFADNSQLTTIGQYAFSSCSKLTSITIPVSVYRISSYAFQSCTKLTDIIFEDTTTWYKTSSSSYTNGEMVEVTDTKQNATWLKSTSNYYNYYWYRELNKMSLNANGGTFEGVYGADEYSFNMVGGIENVSGSSNYGFALNANGYYESQNKGKNNSYSLAKVAFSAKAGDEITFTVINSSQSNYDYGVFSNLNTTLTTSYSADSSNVYKSFKGVSSTSEKTVTYNITEDGEYFIYIKYHKNNSGNSGNDSLQFKSSIISSENIYDYTETLQKVFNDKTPTSSLATPVREGHTFVGWFTEPDGGIQVTEITDMSLTLYAHWQEN